MAVRLPVCQRVRLSDCQCVKVPKCRTASVLYNHRFLCQNSIITHYSTRIKYETRNFFQLFPFQNWRCWFCQWCSRSTESNAPNNGGYERTSTLFWACICARWNYRGAKTMLGDFCPTDRKDKTNTNSTTRMSPI